MSNINVIVMFGRSDKVVGHVVFTFTDQRLSLLPNS